MKTAPLAATDIIKVLPAPPAVLAVVPAAADYSPAVVLPAALAEVLRAVLPVEALAAVGCPAVVLPAARPAVLIAPAAAVLPAVAELRLGLPAVAGDLAESEVPAAGLEAASNRQQFKKEGAFGASSFYVFDNQKGSFAFAES